jgi:uncharacterized protein involved in exopolysaccharide biosynthesis
LSNEATAPSERKEYSVDLMEIATTLWRSRKLIGYIVGIVTALGIVIGLLLPASFKSTAVLLPETDKSKLGSLGGLSDLASLAGVSTGEGSLVRLYPTIIKSESVLRNVVYARYRSEAFRDSVTLIQFWRIEGKNPDVVYETALRSLRDLLDVSMDSRTNVVSISIETTEPQLSADIVNKVTVELDKFIRIKRTTSATEQRKWIEARLLEAKGDLEKSENLLKEFRENNRRVSDSPRLLLEQERLTRDVQINATVYTELKRQYEIVKIEEIKNIPIINVMDAGMASAHKERPKRRLIVLVSFVLSLIGSAGFVFIRQRYSARIHDYLVLFRSKLDAGAKE